jgi:hypothetical protein
VKKILVLVLGLAVLFAFSASALTVSPKISYVGYLGIGCEFAPLTMLTKDIQLMGEINWDFWNWYGGAGYVYGELNAVYKAKPFTMQGYQSPLEPYVGAGLIYGFPMGAPNYGESGYGYDWSQSFEGGIGFGVFGGVTGKYENYTWYAQLKYAAAPITLKWSYTESIPYYGTVSDSGSITGDALGAGMEFGVRFPL